MKNFWLGFKYILYLLIYLIITFIIAYMIFSLSLPEDGQCHCEDMPELIHYIFAAILTLAPIITYIYTKDRKPKIKDD